MFDISQIDWSAIAPFIAIGFAAQLVDGAMGMAFGVITSTLSTSIDDVMQRMTSFRIRHMPIVEGDKLVGIVSIGDVVKSRIEAAEQEATAMRDYIAS